MMTDELQGHVHLGGAMENPPADQAESGQPPSEDIWMKILKVLDEEVQEEFPIPEDTGGGKEDNVDGPATVTSDTDSESQPRSEEWLDVLGNELLKKRVLRAGEGPSSRPQKGQDVKIQIKVFTENGEFLHENSQLCFTVGYGDVIQALDLTVQLMEMGETALVQTDAKYAYGALGSSEPEVPPNEDLKLVVRLLEATDAPDLELLPPAKKIALAEHRRIQGNVHFGRRDYVSAVNSYNIGLQITESSSKVDISLEEENELLEIKVKCLNNLAASQLKLQRYHAARKCCVLVLEHQPDNVKALFRMGKVLACHDEYKQAIEMLRKALKLEPGNQMIRDELSKVMKKYSEYREGEQAMYKKMLGSTSTSTIQEKQPKSWGLSWKWMFATTAVVVGGVALSVYLSARSSAEPIMMM